MRRRTLASAVAGGLAAGLAASTGLPRSVAAPGAPGAQATAEPRRAGNRRLRVAFRSAEAGFDPAQVSDRTSITVNSHIFEAPCTYARLAEPVAIAPLTAAALPEVSDNHRRFVVSLQPGIFFADDPVFKGEPRELVAADYVYTIKRLYDPAIRTEHLFHYENAKLLGLSELRRRVLAAKTAFPYDEPVDGLRVLSRYRFEFRLAEPDPRFIHVLTASSYCCAMAREVVEAYGADLAAHPVGTGPYRLAEWRRSSRIVLERNPLYRERRFDEVAPLTADAATQAHAQRLHGQRLPRVDRIEISILEEDQPRWLAFAGGELDRVELPAVFAPVAMPNGQLAPNLARRGITAQRRVGAEVTHTYFNCDHPLVGGLAPERVALRRAVALAYDARLEIRLARAGQAIPAQSMLPPHVYGHDATLRTESGEASIARSRALLDVYGYLDRDGDGWREQPDGQPLTLRMASTTDQTARLLNEIWKKRLAAAGLRIEFQPAPFAELIRQALAGELMMWGFTWGAGNPDADFFLGLAYGPNAEQNNDARFKLAEFDRVYEAQKRLPDGPERLALIRRAQRLMLAYMPYIAQVHRIETNLAQPGVHLFPDHPFLRDHWTFAEVEQVTA
jgi:ABC-type transport system substrate-binding protein